MKKLRIIPCVPCTTEIQSRTENSQFCLFMICMMEYSRMVQPLLQMLDFLKRKSVCTMYFFCMCFPLLVDKSPDFCICKRWKAMLLCPTVKSRGKQIKNGCLLKKYVELALVDLNVISCDGKSRSSKATARCSESEKSQQECVRIQRQQQGRESTSSRFHHCSTRLWLRSIERIVG